MITINELQQILQNVLQRNITQSEIGKALGTGRSNINLRLKNSSEVKPEEITKLEDFFRVQLLNLPEFLQDEKRKNYKIFYDEHGNQLDVYSMLLSKNYKDKTIENDIIEIERIEGMRPECGTGSELLSEPIVEPFRISRKSITDYLRCSSPENLKTFRASGDSMEDKISDGDWLLVDIGRTDASISGVYVFLANGLFRCKRLNITLDGRLEVKSDNPKYADEVVGPDSNIEIQIIGRVLNNLSKGL